MNYKRLEMTGPEGEIIKGKTPVNGANPYVDNYTGFTWNNIHSSSYNCFIENTGHLEFVGAPDFSNNFVSPAFQTRTYYTGMQNSSKKFSLNLVFYQLTLKELNAAFKWLDRTIVSDLFFDYEPYWKYSCKLASIGTIEKYVSGRTMYRGKPCDLYLCRVAIQFETVYHPEAISAYCAYKYTNDAYDSTDDFHEYSRTTGSDYMPFNEWKDAKITMPGIVPIDLQLPKSWRPMIITSKDYERITENQAYWRFALKNPSAYPTYFKLHFYNVASNISVYQYWNNDWFNNGDGASLGPVDADGWVLPGELDIDAYENSMCICTTSLNLDDDIWLDLHYNSEDGTILCANQLVEQLRTGDSNIPCTHKDAVANVYLPGAADSDHPSTIMIEVTIDRRIIKSDDTTITLSKDPVSTTRHYSYSFTAVNTPLKIKAGTTFTAWPVSHDTQSQVTVVKDVLINDSTPVLLGTNGLLTISAYRNDATVYIVFDMAAQGSGSFDIRYTSSTITYYTETTTDILPQVGVEYDTYEYMI